MSKLPIDGYLSHSDRSQAEMKVALEDVRGVIAEVGGGEAGDAVCLRQIDSAGNIAVPTSQFVEVQPEFDDTPDTLLTMGMDDLPDGRVIYLCAQDTSATSQQDSHSSSSFQTHGCITITSSASAGRIELTAGGSFDLADKYRVLVVRLVTDGTQHWREVTRFYSNSTSANARDWRNYWRLGTAASEDIADGLSLTKDKLLQVKSTTNLVEGNIAVDGDGFIVAGTADGGDADTVDLKHATDLVIRVPASSGTEQDVVSPMQVDGQLSVDAPDWEDDSETAAVSLQLADNERSSIIVGATGDAITDTDMKMRLFTAGAVAGLGIHFDGPNDALLKLPNAGGTGGELLDADDLQAGGAITSAVVSGPVYDALAPQFFTPVYIPNPATAVDFGALAAGYDVNAVNGFGVNWTDVAFPNPGADGTNAFKISLHLSFAIGNSNPRLWSSIHIGGAGGSAVGTLAANSFGIYHGTTNALCYIEINDLLVQPSAGEGVTVLIEEDNGDGNTDLLAHGYGGYYKGGHFLRTESSTAINGTGILVAGTSSQGAGQQYGWAVTASTVVWPDPADSSTPNEMSERYWSNEDDMGKRDCYLLIEYIGATP